MEVVMNGNAPFKREIHEWKHMDEKTGALLRGRSLLQSLETTDGIHHKQHKQMNILQTITNSGSALQVVRAQTSTSSTSSSKRSFNNSNMLLISPRSMNQETTDTQSSVAEIANRMKDLFSAQRTSTTSIASVPVFNDSYLFKKQQQAHDDDHRIVMIKKSGFDVGFDSRQNQINEMLYGNEANKERLRGKSASIEELANIDDDEVEPWKRVSRIRRSLQFPTTSTDTKRINYHHRSSRPVDLPENSVNVLQIKQNIENGCRLKQLQNSAMKSSSKSETNDYVALDSILKSSSNHDDGSSFKRSDEVLTAETLQDIRRRLRKMSNPESLQTKTHSSIEKNYTASTKYNHEQNTKSLELRKNSVESDEWLSRRKSYGFENMQQPSESLNGKVESSVDSGLGLSSDLPSNWSPTITNDLQQRTIIRLGNDKLNPATTSISLFNHGDEKLISEKPIPMRRRLMAKRNLEEDLKRHSIAIDEKVDEHYWRKEADKKISFVNLNGQLEEKIGVDGRPKKVEFCKTEIHFAANSGKVNIVETNTKPPPTNNFRRRRRLSSSEEIASDSSCQMKIENILQPSSENIGVNVTTSIGSVYTTGSGNERDDADECHSEDGLRGILKNKPIKPKPYHLGMEDSNSLWGKLKPIDSDLVKEIRDDHEYEVRKKGGNYNQKPSTRINLSNHQQTKSSFSNASTSNASSDKHLPLGLNENSSDGSLTNNSKGYHKISIDLKLPHPKSMDEIMDELKSTSLIIKTMKSSSYFGDAMKHLEQESPFIRSSSLRLANEALPKSRSTNSILHRYKSSPHRYSSSLDGDHSILDGNNSNEKSLDDNFDFINEFLEENKMFQGQQKEKCEEKHHPPVAAPRFKKILSSNQQLNQKISELRSLYKNINDSDDENAKADEEVKLYLSKGEEENLSELSGSWSKARVRKIANAFQEQSEHIKSSKWSRPSIIDSNLVRTSPWLKDPPVNLHVEAAPRTSVTKSSQEKDNIYSNIQQQDNLVKVNIQNFESFMPSLSRSNSLRVKKEEAVTQKLATGTRQLKAHELTFFGINSAPLIKNNPFESSASKAFQSHLSNEINNKAITNQITSKTTILTPNYHQKPDLIMHHQQTYPSKSSTPELTSCEKKNLMDALDSCMDETKNLEPLYENLKQEKSLTDTNYSRISDKKRDEKILFELSRAADEIMETCKEMYQHNRDENRKSQNTSSLKNYLEPISEVTQQEKSNPSEHKPKATKSKAVQVTRNFEDSLRRYHRIPQQKTSSQSSVESLTHTVASKVSPASSSTIITRIKRGKLATKSRESKSSSTVSRINESGNASDSSRRIHRVSTRELLQKSNASSSESDMPNSSVEEPPRRPRRIKYHRNEEKGRDEKKSNASGIDFKKNVTNSSPLNKVPLGSKLQSSSGKKSSSSSYYPDTTLSSPSTSSTRRKTSHR